MTWLIPLNGEYMKLMPPATGKKQPSSPVIVNGVRYASAKEAGKAVGITGAGIYKRIKQNRGAKFA